MGLLECDFAKACQCERVNRRDESEPSAAWWVLVLACLAWFALVIDAAI